MKNKKGLRISIFLFGFSLILFIAVLIAMKFININEMFQIQGKITEMDSQAVLSFDTLEGDFYGYEQGDSLKIRIHKKWMDATVLKKEKKEGIELTYGDIYSYEIKINTNYESLHVKSDEVFNIPAKGSTSLMDMIYSSQTQ